MTGETQGYGVVGAEAWLGVQVVQAAVGWRRGRGRVKHRGQDDGDGLDIDDLAG
jgi:hypothetical protein